MRPTPLYAGPLNADLSASELTLLHRIYTGVFGDGRWVIYSNPNRRDPSQRLMRVLDSLGVVDFYDQRAGNWPERGMWGARPTCLGANAVFRHDGVVRLNDQGKRDADGTALLDGNPGCVGGWRPDGKCTDCSAERPLDRPAYETYLDAIRHTDTDQHARQVDGPQLYCIEHGWMRQKDVTTTKVCRLTGTEFHDGGLIRG